MGVVSGIAFSCMEKYDDFIVFIKTSMAATAKEVPTTWDPKHENHNISFQGMLIERYVDSYILAWIKNDSWLVNVQNFCY